MPGRLKGLHITKPAILLSNGRFGAAYLPLDAELPAERLAYILQDAKPVLLLTEQQFSHCFAQDTATQLLDDSAVQAQIVNSTFTLAEADTCCAPGYTAVTLKNLSADQPAFVFMADESPLHRKLGVYEVRA